MELQPVAVKRLLKIPAAEFADLPAHLALIDPSFDRLWHRLAEAATFNEKVSIISNWVEKNSIEHDPREQMLNGFTFFSHAQHKRIRTCKNIVLVAPAHVEEDTGDHRHEHRRDTAL